MIVVEHDEDAIRTADYVVDIGPGAGVHGGQVVAEGTPDDSHGQPDSADRRNISPACAQIADARAAAASRATARSSRSSARAATTCKNVTVDIPLGTVHLRHRRLRRRQVHAA